MTKLEVRIYADTIKIVVISTLIYYYDRIEVGLLVFPYINYGSKILKLL